MAADIDMDDLILRASIRRYEPGFRQPMHRHDTASVTLVLRGMLRETAGRDEVVAQSLSLVVKPEGVAHANDFGPHWVTTCQILLRPEAHDSRRWRDAISRWRWVVGGPSVRAAIGLARLLIAPHSDSDEREEATAAVLDSLGDHGGSKPIPSWLPNAVDFLRERVDSGAQRIRVADAAASVGVHPVHLSRVFLDQFGCTVSSWIRRLRVQRVASRLPATGERLSSLAMRAGFADHSHMNRSFQRETALLPSEFRGLVSSM